MEIKRAGVHAEMQETLAAAAFDAAPVGLLLVDANLRILSANHAFAEWARCTVDAAVGQVLARFLSAVDAIRMEAAVRRALAGQDAIVDIAAAADPLNKYAAHCRVRRGRGAVPAVVVAIEPLAAAADVTEQLSAEQAASQAQWEMQVIADRLPALVAYVDTDLRYRYVNRRFESWYQKPASWFLGRTVEEVVGEAFAITGPLLRRAARGESLQFDYPRHNPLLSPPERTIRVQLVPDLKAGAPRGFIALMEDVTESLSAEIALRESEERLRQITDTIDDMFWLIEVGNPRSMYVSPGFEAIYGRGGDDIGGSPEAWLEWVHSDDRERMRGHFEALAQGVGYAEEYRILRPDGAVRWVLEKAHRVSTARPGVVLIAGLTSDVTDRRRLIELKRLKEEAETANRTKSEFLSKMSHELRTPLNAVLGFAQLLQFDTTRPLDDAQRDSVEEIIGAGRHLLAIVDEMLDLTRIEMGKLRISYEAVALADVIAECVSMVQTQARLRAISLNSYTCRPGCRPLVYADRTRVRQILLNLLSNAIKYNVEGGQVDIVFDKVANGRVRLSVQDTGPGLDPAQIEQLFVPFQRLDAERITCEGLGLGLALSKQLTEAMGGAIGAKCESGRGCAFWLELPLASGSVPE